MVKSSKSKWTYLYIVLAGPLAEPRGATETVGVVHYQYHIDQQPHQRCEQHNPACVGTNLASEHSRVADGGHFSLHRDGEDWSIGFWKQSYNDSIASFAIYGTYTLLLAEWLGFFTLLPPSNALTAQLPGRRACTVWARDTTACYLPHQCSTPERFRPLAIYRNWITLTHRTAPLSVAVNARPSAVHLHTLTLSVHSALYAAVVKVAGTYLAQRTMHIQT